MGKDYHQALTQKDYRKHNFLFLCTLEALLSVRERKHQIRRGSKYTKPAEAQTFLKICGPSSY